MLTFLGFGMVITFMYLIMTKRLSPLVALIMVPIIFGLIGGFAAGMGDMMLDGLRKIAPIGIMLMFAILYFGIMMDAGLFDPLVARILKIVGGDPVKVVMGTALLALVISFDGDGATTYMITCAAMLPLYRRLGMSVLNLVCVTNIANGIMNLVPWGGPTGRAASALHVDPTDLFVPMIPAMVVSAIGLLTLAWMLGKREQVRLGVLTVDGPSFHGGNDDESALKLAIDQKLKRPKLFWVNFGLTILLMTTLILGLLPLPVLFAIGFCIAIVINYPNLQEQRERVAAHAPNLLPVVGLIFAAGIFTGILSGTGMVEAMSNSLLAVIPDELGPYLAPITALISLPFTFFVSNDAFYFGVLPIIAETALNYGITAEQMGRASLIGQPVHLLSPLVPATYLLVGLAGVEFGDHQRYTLKWAIGISMLMLVASLAFGIFPLIASVG